MTDQEQAVPNFQPPNGAMPPTPGIPPSAPQSMQSGVADSLVVDMTGVTDDDEPIPDGWYKLLVEDIQTHKDGVPLKSSSGEPKITWRFRVAEGPRMGRTLFVSTNVSGAGVFAVRRILKAFHGGDLAKGPVQITLSNYRGRHVWGYVGVQKNNPQYNEIKKYLPESQTPPGMAQAGAVVPPQQAPIANRI